MMVGENKKMILPEELEMIINEYSKPLTTRQINCVIGINKGDNNYYLRKYEPIEIERLFMFPHKYIDYNHSLNYLLELYGNSVIITVIQYILHNLKV